ncbi:MAG: Isoquinoline 1-oxidoreductase subunit [Chloroflexi bacterium]|nr:MAG: Isoquinoline 1-oxidoreductase subunit [Chloroflexota bacterium]
MTPRAIAIIAPGVAALAVAVLAASTVRAQTSRELRAPSAFAGIKDPAARSAALFVEAGKVLRHPRCQNCHPDGDRPSQGTGYPHQPPVQRGADGLGVTTMRCTTCHQAATMAWQRRSLAEICAQVKDPARNGGHPLSEIDEHMARDPLVGWAWNPGEGREPAPGTQASFGALVKAWADSGAACPTR